MNRRHAIYLGLIALLVLANIGRWWLHQGKAESAARERTFLAEDFRLRVDVPDAGGASRNLFAAQGGAPGLQAPDAAPKRAAARAKPASVVKASVPPPAPPVPPEAESSLGKLRLLGVVFHGGKRQAYLALEKENAMVASGDRVFGQYAVEKIAVDAVELRDLKNNTTRRIPVSGK